ncbi:glutamate 5-kinase, partial [Reticulomyxa filosa]
ELKMKSNPIVMNKGGADNSSNSLTKKKVEKGEWGTGGMVTKLTAAKFATCCGIHVIIMSSLHLHKVHDVLQTWKEKQTVEIGTLFVPINTDKKLAARQRWLLGLSNKGKIYLDAGAVGALLERKSLFAVGVKHIEGSFLRNDVVTLCEFAEKKEDGSISHSRELARGKINYSSVEMKSVLGKKKGEIETIFGESTYVMDRENIVLFPHVKQSDRATE